VCVRVQRQDTSGYCENVRVCYFDKMQEEKMSLVRVGLSWGFFFPANPVVGWCKKSQYTEEEEMERERGRGPHRKGRDLDQRL
jgi:hypothetical protein